MKNSYLTGTDQFCGAGGTSTGAKHAGIEIKMALNHWKLAIETHNTNHPEVDHDCTDIQACDPRRYPSTNFLFTSPECTNHSLAKGRKKKREKSLSLFSETIDQKAERSRATMWDVPRFAEYHDYEYVVVENVVDARDWIMWDAWLMAIHSLGYKHKCLYLNSMFFHPCPQSRDRLYVVFWKKGNKTPDLEFRPVAFCQKCGEDRESYQNWKRPDRKYGKYKFQYVYRCSGCYEKVTPYYYCALNIVDWSVPITRIGDRKKPLVERTMARIRYGLEKYGNQQMVISNAHNFGMDCRIRLAHQKPFPTQTGDSNQYLLSSVHIHSDSYLNKVRGADDPMYAQTTRQEQNLFFPPPSIVNLRNNRKANSAGDPIKTVTTGGINQALLVGNYSPGWTRPLNGPVGTVTTGGQQSLLTAKAFSSLLTYYYGNGHQCADMSDPVYTVRTVDSAALVQPEPKVEDCYYRVLKPHEIQRAMAFEDGYQVLGNSKQKVKQLGNAVTPPVMQWITERCIQALS